MFVGGWKLLGGWLMTAWRFVGDDGRLMATWLRVGLVMLDV